MEKFIEIFKAKEKDFSIGISDIHITTEDEFEDMQINYRIDEKGNPLNNWIGEDFYIIGIDSCNEDPIIVNIDDDNLPIYYMFHDDLDSLKEIAPSFKKYQEIMNIIEEYSLIEDDECYEVLNKIENIVSEESMEYWESLIENAHEFFNQE